MKKITVLGVTGSIGTQTIDVVTGHPDEFEIVAMSAGHNIKKLEEIMNQLPVPHICVLEQKDYDYLSEKYPDRHFYLGQEGLIQISTLEETEIVLNAIVGFAGLLPTIEAIKAGKDIALANKETLVVAGHIIIPLAKEYGIQLLPVDSEHSAIFQSLNGENPSTIEKILLTASGGPFRGRTIDEMRDVRVEDALKHPNWSMGHKITIDSATMVNKGLEVMEARWLFGVDIDDVTVVVQPQSVIHSMVQYVDGSIIAQLGCPDMRLPIQYALYYPERKPMDIARLDFAKLASITFEAPDMVNFKGLALAYKAGRRGGNLPTILNAANEFAVAQFLGRKCGFLDITDMIEKAMDCIQYIDNPDVNDILDTEKAVYEFLR